AMTCSSAAHALPGIAPAFDRVRARGDEAVADLTHQLHRFGLIGGDVDRNPVMQIDEAHLLMEEANGTANTAFAILDFAAGEQSAHNADVLTQLAQRIRRQSHRAAGAVASADSAYYAARCDLIQRAERTGRHGSDSRARDRDAGPEH